jgi:hypothetical protein
MFDNEWDVEGWLDSAMFTTRILKCKVEVSADRMFELGHAGTGGGTRENGMGRNDLETTKSPDNYLMT